MTLPEVIDMRAHAGNMTQLAEVSAGGDCDFENPYAWRIEYQCRYAEGVLDDRLHGRAMMGDGLSAALARLQRLLAGFGATSVLVWHVRRPATAAEIAGVREINDELERAKTVERAVRDEDGNGSRADRQERAGSGRLGRGVDEPAGHPRPGRAGALRPEGRRRAVPGAVPGMRGVSRGPVRQGGTLWED